MARPKNITPQIRRHRNSARCWVNGRWVELGRYGSAESLVEHARICGELASSPAAAVAPRTTLTVTQLLAAFWQHAEHHYRHADGTSTSEVGEIQHALGPVRRLYGHTSATDFGPRALAAVRQAMIDSGWCRTLINRRVERIRRMYRWAVSQELVPATSYTALKSLPGLQRGRTEARESEPVKPVEPAIVAATLPFLTRHLRTMVELQRLTGMRPGEVCSLRLAEVDRKGEIWIYRPLHHKTAHRGRERVILFGPRSRKVLEDFIASGRVVDPVAPLFSPFRAREERFESMRANRKSKVPPSQIDRSKAEPQLLPADEYTPHTYAHAIRAAAEKAFPLPEAMGRRAKESREDWKARVKREHEAEAKAWHRAHHWHPNQLRHLYASEVRKGHGLEAAQVLLGHASANITQVYAERDLTLATAVAAKIG